MGIGMALHFGREFDLQAARQYHAVAGFEQVGDAALARLTVDPDHRAVAAAEIGRVDGQIGHVPQRFRLLCGKAFPDRVLMRSGKRGEDKVANVRVARMDRQLCAVFRRTRHCIDIGKIEPRCNALGVKVERERDEVDVACTLAVAEQATLDPFGAGQHRQLGGGHRRTPVVVRVHAENHAVAPGEMTVHPLDLVGIDIGRGHLHRTRQIEDDLVRGRRPPFGSDGVADLPGEVELGGGKGLRAVFEHPFRLRLGIGEFADQPYRGHGHVDHLRLAHAEHDIAERLRGGVVDVDDGAARTAQRFHRATDQMLACLGQHFDGHVVRNVAAFDERAHEIEIGLRGRGESHLDLLETDIAQHAEHPHLACTVHRLEQRLVAVAQIGTHPDGRGSMDPVRPLAVGEANRRKRTVLGAGGVQHGLASSKTMLMRNMVAGTAGRMIAY